MNVTDWREWSILEILTDGQFAVNQPGPLTCSTTATSWQFVCKWAIPQQQMRNKSPFSEGAESFLPSPMGYQGKSIAAGS